MVWNLFKKKKDNNNEEEAQQKQIEADINKALQKAKEDKQLAERGMKDLQNWAAEAIMDTYGEVFPNGHLSYYRDKYKDEAFEKYEQIKAEHAPKMDQQMVAKCDKIVQGYKNQLKLQTSKIELYTKLYNEFVATKKRFEEVKARNAKSNKLDKHKNRLETMDNDSKVLADSYTQSYKLEDLQKEVELRGEYFNQLEKLSKEYGDDSNYDNAVTYKSEVDKMLKGLN